MFQDRTRVLLILSRDALDRARVLAGRATTSLKLPVSLQIILRALIEEGLKRSGDPTLLANIESQAEAVRLARRLARRGGSGEGVGHDRQTGSRTQPGGRALARRRK